MKVFKKIIGVVILICSVLLFSTLLSASVELKSTALLSYGEWKAQTRQQIQKKVHLIEQKLSEQKEAAAFESKSPIFTKLEKKQIEDNLQIQLRFEKMKLEASEDLSFHEYFLGYLSEQKDFDKSITELAKILKPDDIRELITSYGKLVQKKKHDGQHGYKTSTMDN